MTVDPSKATDFMEHLRRSFHYTIDHLGPHNLPLIGRADWNDCLNLNCFSTEPGESFQTFGPSEGPNAESVFIAGMFVRYGKDYVEICRHRGLDDEAALAEKAIADMEKQFSMPDGTANGSFVHTITIRTRSVLRNAKKARFSSSLRDSALWPKSV